MKFIFILEIHTQHCVTALVPIVRRFWESMRMPVYIYRV